MRDTIIFSLKLKSGDFISELHLPMPSTPEEVRNVTERWLDFMASGLRMATESMDATFTKGGNQP